MAETSKEVTYNVAAKVIVILIIAAVLLTLSSILVIWILSHNIYAASYYSISALFDANNEGAPLFISSFISANQPYSFYGFIAVSLVDGFAKVIIIGFLIAAFINLLSNIDLKSKIETITAKHFKDHVIICGYSMLAERLCSDLRKSGVHFVIVDKDPEKVNLLRDLRMNVIEGDFTEENTLRNAAISKAKSIVFATESDFINLLGIVTAHHIDPKANIIARSRGETSVRKMQRGGAALCVVPEVVAGVELGEKIVKM